jgi:ribosomal protein L29
MSIVSVESCQVRIRQIPRSIARINTGGCEASLPGNA